MATAVSQMFPPDAKIMSHLKSVYSGELFVIFVLISFQNLKDRRHSTFVSTRNHYCSKRSDRIYCVPTVKGKKN